MHITIPEIKTPGELSRMTSELQAFLVSDACAVVVQNIEAMLESEQSALRGAIEKEDYKRAHRCLGAIEALESICNKGVFLPGVASTFESQTEKRKSRVKKTVDGLNSYIGAH